MVAKAVCSCVLVWLWDCTKIRIVAKSIVVKLEELTKFQSRWDYGNVIWPMSSVYEALRRRLRTRIRSTECPRSNGSRKSQAGAGHAN